MSDSLPKMRAKAKSAGSRVVCSFPPPDVGGLLSRVMIHTFVSLLPQLGGTEAGLKRLRSSGCRPRSGVFLRVRERGLEHFDPSCLQQAVHGDEEVVGGEEPQDT